MKQKLLDEIEIYWDKRAESYSKVNQEELLSEQETLWRNEIQARIEKNYPRHIPKEIKVLDIGTGPGFFAIILAKAGYQVTAIDYTKAMLLQAKKNAKDYSKEISFYEMDAQNLLFQENSFDVIVSRNLTWVLQDPNKAYSSWTRVLKKKGLLLNFDANWYAYLFDQEKQKEYERDRENVKRLGVEDHYLGTDIDAMEAIARQVPLSRQKRPLWDVKILEELQMNVIRTDLSVWERVWSKIEKLNYAATPMFLVEVVK